MLIKRGDIVWLNKELSLSLGKNVQDINRPFVVISNNTNNRFCPTVNIACLSKQESKANYPMHILLDKEKYNLEYSSVIYIEQLLTVNKDEIVEIVCSLDNEDLERLDETIYLQLIDERKRNFSKINRTNQ